MGYIVSDPQSQKAQSEHLNVTMTREPGARIKLDVTVSPAALDSAYAKAIKLVNKEVSLPGFRKGKAPDDFIVKNYGKQVDVEWRELVLNTSLQESLALLNLRPFRNESIRCTEVKEFSREKGAQFIIEFEAAPQVPVIKIEELQVNPIPLRSISDAELNQFVEDLRLRNAAWESVTDHPVQKNDYVDLTIERLDEPKSTICTNTRFEVAKMASWMRHLVIGANLNDSVEGTSEPDANKPNDAPFQPVQCRITIQGINKPTLPELNDAFAQKVGAENEESLKKLIRQHLEQKAKEEQRDQLYRQLDDLLLAKYPVDLPASLIEEEKKQRIEDATLWLDSENASEETRTNYLNSLEGKLSEQIEKGYGIFFLLSAYANRNNLQVTDEEVSHELIQEMIQGQHQAMSNKSQQQEASTRIKQQLLQRKSRDLILDQIVK